VRSCAIPIPIPLSAASPAVVGGNCVRFAFKGDDDTEGDWDRLFTPLTTDIDASDDARYLGVLGGASALLASGPCMSSARFGSRSVPA